MQYQILCQITSNSNDKDYIDFFSQDYIEVDSRNVAEKIALEIATQIANKYKDYYISHSWVMPLQLVGLAEEGLSGGQRKKVNLQEREVKMFTHKPSEGEILIVF